MTDPRPYPSRQEIIDADAELRDLRAKFATAGRAVKDDWPWQGREENVVAFMEEVAQALENGFDFCCVECGVGLNGDGMEMHVEGCSREPKEDE